MCVIERNLCAPNNIKAILGETHPRYVLIYDELIEIFPQLKKSQNLVNILEGCEHVIQKQTHGKGTDCMNYVIFD